MPRKLLIGMLAVLLVCLIAAAGYRVGRYLAGSVPPPPAPEAARAYAGPAD